MMAVLTAEDAIDWSYRGEGAVNLVLSYSGDSPEFVCIFSLHFCFSLEIYFCQSRCMMISFRNVTVMVGISNLEAYI